MLDVGGSAMKHKKKVLANRINELCKEQRISYYTLSYKSTVPLTTLLHIVDGSTQNPGIMTIIKICEGLNISIKDFFDTEEFAFVQDEDAEA